MNNVLFIFVDQWPAWAFSFKGADIPTPNIDRLAAHGTVFNNAFTVCPLCTPARGSLLTSLWPNQTGIIDNLGVGYSTQVSMPLEQKTWIEEAAARNFHVGYFGKWHLGRNNPEKRGAHGYDSNVELRATPYDPSVSNHCYKKTVADYQKKGDVLIKGKAPFWGETVDPKEQLQPFPAYNKGVEFLKDWAAGSREKPFFLTVSAAPPHFPHYLPGEYCRLAEELLPRIKLPASFEDNCSGRPWFHATPFWASMDTSGLTESDWKTIIAFSHAHIAMVDEAAGRVLDTLENLGLSSSTTVVFTSDHGDMEGAHARFDKSAYFYDEVWRIPLIIRTSGAAATQQNAYVSLIDIGETLFDCIGASGGQSNRRRMGRSLLPLTGTAQRPDHWPQTAYGYYSRYNGYSFEVRSIRNEKYKYVWNPQDINELYDMQADPHEMQNLAGLPDTEAIQRELHKQLVDWCKHIGDNLPERVDQLCPAGTIIATGAQGP